MDRTAKTASSWNPSKHPIFNGIACYSQNFLGYRQAGKVLGISAPAVIKRCKSKKLPYVTVNDRIYIPESYLYEKGIALYNVKIYDNHTKELTMTYTVNSFFEVGNVMRSLKEEQHARVSKCFYDEIPEDFEKIHEFIDAENYLIHYSADGNISIYAKIDGVCKFGHLVILEKDKWKKDKYLILSDTEKCYEYIKNNVAILPLKDNDIVTFGLFY